MAATGQAEPLLWVALGADVVVTAGIGTIGWKGLQALDTPALPLAHDRLLGAAGVAASDLEPDGVVRVRSETWSATSLNGPITKGTPVQVIEVTGIRLGVWGENDETPFRDRPRLEVSGLDDNTIPGNSPGNGATGAS
jgi:membrane-bound ClpP family serine protease